MSNKDNIENNKELGIKSYAEITNKEIIVGSNFPHHDKHSMNQSMNVRKLRRLLLRNKLLILSHQKSHLLLRYMRQIVA